MFASVLRWWPAVFALALAGPASAQDIWRAYQFHGNEDFRYDLKQTVDSTVTTGFYRLSISPAGAGQMQLDIQGKLAGVACSGSATVESGAASPYQLTTGCQMMAPILVGAFMPMSTWFMNRPLTPGDTWDVRQGGETVSFSVNGTCTHAGQDGHGVEVRHNNDLRLKACLAPDIGLPLAVFWTEEGDDPIEIELVGYQQ
ncbi:MAG: hypothetical protein HKM89_11975 [Gemmatimonadales bacterium]|nr:hypothetical protein [Gemmatimonadales bacterium]